MIGSVTKNHKGTKLTASFFLVKLFCGFMFHLVLEPGENGEERSIGENNLFLIPFSKYE